MRTNQLNNLNRLFNPKNIAVFGGNDAEIVISQCKKMGFKVKFGL
jgi:acyl-CoA synthetase (NDP forming)